MKCVQKYASFLQRVKVLHSSVKFSLAAVCKHDLSETDTAPLECYLNTNFSCVFPSHVF